MTAPVWPSRVLYEFTQADGQLRLAQRQVRRIVRQRVGAGGRLTFGEAERSCSTLTALYLRRDQTATAARKVICE